MEISIYYVIQSFLSIMGFKKKNFWMEILVFFIVMIFVGLRYEVGNDYIPYYQQFYNIKNGGSIYFEPIYLFLNKILPTPESLIFSCSLISFIFIYKSLCYFKINKIEWLSIYFGFFLIIYNIHLIRQGVAISIGIYAFKYIEKNKFLMYIFWCLIAIGFHKSAVLLIPLYFVSQIEITKKKALAMFIISIFLSLFLQKFGNFLFLGLGKIPMFQRYVEVYNNQIYSSSYGFSIGMLFDTSIFILSIFKLELRSKDQKILFNIFLFSILLTYILNFSSIFLRVNYYYRIVVIFFILELKNITRQKKLIQILVMIICLLYIYQHLNKGNARLEYRTIFNKIKI